MKFIKGEKSKFFLGIFYRIGLLTLTLMILMASLLYYNFQLGSIDILTDANNKLMKQMGYFSEYIHQNAVNFSISVYDLPETKLFMNSSSINTVDLVEGVDNISSFASKAPYIHSLYIYNPAEKKVYSFGDNRKIVSLSDFEDREAFDACFYSQEIKKLAPAARYTAENDTNGQKREPVYSYYMFDKINVPTEADGVLIVNIRADWVYNALKKMNENQQGSQSEMFVADFGGKIVGASNNEFYLRALSSIPEIEEQLSDSSVRKIKTVGFENKKYILNSLAMPELKWRFIYLTPIESFYTPIRNAMIKAISVASIVLVLAFFAVYFFAGMMYQPLKKLANVIRNFGHPEDFNSEGYKSALSKSYEAMVNYSKNYSTLQQFRRESIRVVKEDYISKLLNSDKPYKINDGFLYSTTCQWPVSS